MLKARHFYLIHQNPSFCSCIPRSASPLPANPFWIKISRKLMASTKIAAEYAKSNRSTCKKCSRTIPARSLRLGVVSRDPRGFDATKWHHLDCYPMDSLPIVAAEKISGFSLLKDADQERLKKLEAGPNKECKTDEAEIDERQESKVEILKTDEANVDERQESKLEILMNRGRNETLEVEVDEKILKKPKLSGNGMEIGLEISFSVADVKNKYKDIELLPRWKAFNTLIFLEQDDDLRDSEKIAAFDFDGCLVQTSVKRIGPDAWSLLYPNIAGKLQSLYDDGYKLVIFTNESNIERWKDKRKLAIDSKIGRLNNFMKSVKVPIQVFIACGLGSAKGQIADPFRKPKPGMWKIMENHFNSGISIDMSQSFYVGDAAGRANDHSDADKKFAEVVGLRFYLPEEYFGV